MNALISKIDDEDTDGVTNKRRENYKGGDP